MDGEVPEIPEAPREPAASPQPEELLSELAAMRRRTRSARHAYWFPLVLFGLLTCAAAPLYVSAATPPPVGRGGGATTVVFGGTPSVLGGMSAGSSGSDIGWYWLVALVGGYLLTLLWYRWHSRKIGVETPARGPIVTGVVLTVLALLLPVLSQIVPFLNWLWPGDLWARGTFAFLIIAAGLWVLARAERSLGLVITAAVYTGAAILVSLYNVENVLFRWGWNPGNGDWPLTVLPGVLLPAIVLLVAGVAASVTQRPRRQVRPV